MFLDIGVGILLGLWLGPSHSTFSNVAFGIMFTLLPDSDIFLYFTLRNLLKKKFNKQLREHRVFFHYPLPFLVIVGSVVYWLNPSLLPLFIAGTLVQFIHDSIGPGWGIPWFYPFSKKYFKFFYQLDLHLTNQPQKLMWVWSKEEQIKLGDEYINASWRKNLFHFIKAAPMWNLFEFCLLIIGLSVLIIHS
jgi:hypothetical protein